MTTITITLPEELAEKAKAKGLLSPEAIESYVRDKLGEPDPSEPIGNTMSRAEIDARMKRLLSPEAFKVYRKGKILGDIVGPFHEVWAGEDLK